MFNENVFITTFQNRLNTYVFSKMVYSIIQIQLVISIYFSFKKI